MALTDVTTRLYASTAYRNTPVLKALSDAFVMNLKFRFSLVGMAAALTGSRTLYGIAQQKYLVSDEERKQEKNEIEFKKHVVTSLSTLSKQVSILESIVERNTLMISAISNDLGYFKGQRKMSMDSYGQLKSFRVPLNSKSVKSQLETVSAEILKLKQLKKGTSAEDLKQKKIEEAKTRAIIAASVATALGAIGLKALGAGNLATAVGSTVLGGLSAAFSSEIAQQVSKKVMTSAFPVLGTVLKAGLLASTGFVSREFRRAKGEMGVQLGTEESYINSFDPRKNPIEWRARQNEIELLKNLNKNIEVFSEPLDEIFTFLTLYYGFRGGMGLYKTGKKLTSMFRGASVAPAAAATVGATAITGGLAVGTVRGGRVWTGRGWRTVGGVPAAPVDVPTSRRVRRVPRSVLTALEKLNSWAKGPASKLGAASLAFALVEIGSMYSAASQYESGAIQYSEYKERMVSGFKMLVSTIGAIGVGAALGTIVGGPLGFIVGAIGGVGVSILADDANQVMAEKLFAILAEGEAPTIAETTESMSNLTPEMTANYAARTQAPEQVERVISEDKDFMVEVLRVSDEYNLDPSDLLAVMYRESRLDPSAKNPKSTATGLIQFTEATAKNLGTTTAALRIMSAAQQMKYVEKYFEYWKVPKTGISRGELYGYIFMPGRVSSGVFAVSGTDEFSLNAGLDLDDDQMITIADLAAATSMDGGKAYMAAAETARLDSGVNSALNSQILEYFAKDSASVAAPPDSEKISAQDAMLAAVAAQEGTMKLVNYVRESEGKTKDAFNATKVAIDTAKAEEKIPKTPAERMRDDSFDSKFVYA